MKEEGVYIFEYTKHIKIVSKINDQNHYEYRNTLHMK